MTLSALGSRRTWNAGVSVRRNTTRSARLSPTTLPASGTSGIETSPQFWDSWAAPKT